MPSPETLIGRPVTDAHGTYGQIEELFVGRTSGRPEFAVVATADKRVAVPLRGAHAEGDGVVLGVARDRVLAAPALQGDVEAIPPGAGDRVLAFFGFGPETEAPADPTDLTAQTAAMAPAPEPADDVPVEVTLAEERLEVRKERLPAERVRLRKKVVREEVSITVTLEREELVIEREPVTADGAPPPPDPGGLGGDATEFVLYAEEPVVEKRVVAVERVRVRRGEVTETRQIVDQVRREHLDIDQTTTKEPTR